MKRIAFCIFGAIAASGAAFAQTAPPGDPALLAGPANLREGATIIKWKADYTYDTVKKGTNRLVCFDISGMAGQQPFSVECTSIANIPRVAQNLKFEAEPDKAKRQASIDTAEKNGSRVKPEFGSVWYHLRGPDRERARPHTTIAVPGATTASLGLPENPSQGGVWIMDAGTSTAHLMTPGE
jgi:hypothetical protein